MYVYTGDSDLKAGPVERVEIYGCFRLTCGQKYMTGLGYVTRYVSRHVPAMLCKCMALEERDDVVVCLEVCTEACIEGFKHASLHEFLTPLYRSSHIAFKLVFARCVSVHI